MASRRGPGFSARVAFSGKWDQASWANIIWLMTESTQDITPQDANALAAACHLTYTTHWPAALLSSWSIEATHVTYFPLGTDTVVFGEHIESNAGALPETLPTPASMAVVVSWFASVYWRGGKPRTYLAGVPTNDMVDGRQLTAAKAADLNSRATNFRLGLNAISAGAFSGVTFGLVSFRAKKQERPAPLFFPITANRVGTRVDSQRRRLGREVL